MILPDLIKIYEGTTHSYYCDGCVPPELWDDVVPVCDDEFENDDIYPICRGCGKVHDEVFIKQDVCPHR